MKNILIVLILLLPTIGVCQESKSYLDINLGIPSERVILNQSTFDNNSDLKETLINAYPYKGGFCLIYSQNIEGNETQFTFYFDANSMCYAERTISGLKSLGSQLKTLSEFCTSINEHTLIGKDEDIKVTYYSDLKNNFAIFIYTRKNVLPPQH